MTNDYIPHEALLSLSEVMRLIRLGQSEIYARMMSEFFPAPRQVGLRKFAWLAADVLDWTGLQPYRRGHAAASRPHQSVRLHDPGITRG